MPSPGGVQTQRELHAPARVLTEDSSVVQRPHQLTGSESFWEHKAARILLSCCTGVCNEPPPVPMRLIVLVHDQALSSKSPDGSWKLIQNLISNYINGIERSASHFVFRFNFYVNCFNIYYIRCRHNCQNSLICFLENI